jgi:putative RNA 2'-phosphotransferase
MTHLSKTLSWLLRHGASECGLELDPEGYANLDTVVEVMRSRKIIITKAAIIDLASAGDPLKQRLQVIGEVIRANYGHSRGTNIQYAAATPPATLYHGTTEAAFTQIQATGLQPMQREFVHLTTDIALAKIVAIRHGPPLIISVDTKVALATGVIFYRANERFWLTKSVPASCLSVLK